MRSVLSPVFRVRADGQGSWLLKRLLITAAQGSSRVQGLLLLHRVSLREPFPPGPGGVTDLPLGQILLPLRGHGNSLPLKAETLLWDHPEQASPLSHLWRQLSGNSRHARLAVLCHLRTPRGLQSPVLTLQTSAEVCQPLPRVIYTWRSNLYD